MKIAAVDKLIPAPKDGANGTPATSYYMLPGYSCIVLDSSLSPNVGDFSIYGFKIIGSSSPVNVKNKVNVTYIGNKNDTITGSCPFALKMTDLAVKFQNGLTNIHIEMYDDAGINISCALDIPVVRDGSQGPKGDTGEQGPKGDTGEKGADGTSFTIKGVAEKYLNSSSDVVNVPLYGYYIINGGEVIMHVPAGNSNVTVAIGDAWRISDDDASYPGHILVYSEQVNTRWLDLGKITGPKGDKGDTGDKGEKGDTGEKGSTGAAGIAGPIAYFAGAWQNSVAYTRTDEKCPVVEHNDFYWAPKEIGSNIGGEPSVTSSFWKLVTSDDIIYTKIIMAEFGKLASAIFSGSFMFSQFGKLNGTEINEGSDNKDIAYKNFDFSDPSNVAKFVPNLLINFLTGYLRCVNADIEGNIDAVSGSIGGFEISDGRIGIATKTKDAEGNEGINDNGNTGLFLYKDLIGFNTSDRQAIFGTWDNFGIPILGKLTDTASTFQSKYGLQFNITNSIYGQNFAFLGNGVGCLNGFVEGYRFEKIILYSNTTIYHTGSSSGPLKCNKFYVSCQQKTGALLLPELSTMRKTLGINVNSQFSFKIIYLAELGTQSYRLYGRNSLKNSSGNTPWNDDDYPTMIDYNGNYMEYKPHEAGDSISFELCYNPSLTNTVNGYSCKYTARVINISE
jgi:hypothetical protein